jgi:hypothetical protein
MARLCSKGKSCGATCIQRSKWCELELGAEISKSISKVRSKLGVVKLYFQVRDQKIKGGQAKFEKIRKDLAGEIGGRINRTADLIELKNRLQKEGLVPKTKKSEEDLGAIFARQIAAGKKSEPVRPKFTPLPTDIKNQLAALPPPPQAPRQLSQSPGGARMRPPAATKDIFDDISRILRGESPQNIEVASGIGREGFKVREKQTTSASGSATGNTKWARLDAKDHDNDLGKVRREGDKSYNGWKDSYGSGARKVGEGAYGTVIKNPDGIYVKRGDISDTEAALIKRLGDVDLGPKLRAADINGPARYHKENFVDVKNGRIAMGEVPGKPIGQSGPAQTFGGKNAADIYWKAMADLHRMGIAHNDAHVDNILVDKNGKGRWVDLGLAQANPKAALAEAMGVFNTIKGAEPTRVQGAYGQGNWQTRRWDGTGVRAAEKAREAGGQKWREFMERFPVASRVWENRPDAQYALLRMGLTKNDVSSIIDHGIRSTPESYTKGAWAKLTDKQAQEVLNILYDGI